MGAYGVRRTYPCARSVLAGTPAMGAFRSVARVTATTDREALESGRYGRPVNLEIVHRRTGRPRREDLHQLLQGAALSLRLALHRSVVPVGDPAGEPKAQSLMTDKVAKA